MQSLGSSRVTIISRPLACFAPSARGREIVATRLEPSGGGFWEL